MKSMTDSLRPDISSDPFQEHARGLTRRRIQILGARFEFESRSRTLLDLVDSAYAGLPRHQLSRLPPRLRVRLELLSGAPRCSPRAPPSLETLSGFGFLGGATARSHFAVLAPAERRALVVVPQTLLQFPYHLRYELIEFVVSTLAARVQQLLPLHAACVGIDGRGVLLMGGSGAGKSTLALHCMLQGFEFMAEDSTFVGTNSMRATGVANFVHVHASSLKFLERGCAAMIRRSPIIRRRSGVAKYEVDVRGMNLQLATAPLKIGSLVFISRSPADCGPLLRPLAKMRALACLRASQPYAASLPGWGGFMSRAARLEAFELRRGRHPQEAVMALQELYGKLRR